MGIVVQNDDPDRRGRVKVYVPHVSITVYDKWNDNFRDKRFRFQGENLTSSLNEIHDDINCYKPTEGMIPQGRNNAE